VVAVANTAAPGTKSAAIKEIDRVGFKYEEVAQYDLSQLSVDRRVQVREPKHYAPKDAVEQYAIQMGETEFPPIVVTSDGWIVDGNTRVGARLKRKEKFNPALVLDVVYNNATERQRDDLHVLAATLNSQNGTRLTAKEARNAAAWFIERGVKPELIARAIGLRPSSITAVRKEIEASKKLAKVGMDDNGDLKGASLRALGAKDVINLNDVPFKELASLAGDAGLNASEIVAAAKAARETGSDSGALEYLAKEREEFGDRIREKSYTGASRPPVSRQLRQHLGFVTKFSGREHELLETDPKVFNTAIETLENAITVLQTLLAIQQGRYSEVN
jgi:hypothetical protein